MVAEQWNSSEQVARLVRQSLEEGATVEIDGLGSFRPSPDGQFEFVPQTRPQVFLAYVEEDYAIVHRLYSQLRAHGCEPWLDKKKLLAGQNWPRAIEQAIEISSFFVPCFSKRAGGKRGHFQAELRWALDCASRLPLDDVYIIPVRLEECTVPQRIRRELQYIDLFPDWDRGFQGILDAMDGQESRSRGRLRLAG
jgi:hypothetical protein